jgi:hypothetical protein
MERRWGQAAVSEMGHKGRHAFACSDAPLPRNPHLRRRTSPLDPVCGIEPHEEWGAAETQCLVDQVLSPHLPKPLQRRLPFPPDSRQRPPRQDRSAQRGTSRE